MIMTPVHPSRQGCPTTVSCSGLGFRLGNVAFLSRARFVERPRALDCCGLLKHPEMARSSCDLHCLGSPQREGIDRCPRPRAQDWQNDRSPLLRAHPTARSEQSHKNIRLCAYYSAKFALVLQPLIGLPGSTSRTSPSVMPQLARVAAGMCPTISTTRSDALADFVTASFAFSSSPIPTKNHCSRA